MEKKMNRDTQTKKKCGEREMSMCMHTQSELTETH